MRALTPIFCLITLTLGSFLFSCKSLRQPEQQALKPLPGSFSGSTDSVSSGAISWKQYFSDPALAGLIDEGIKGNLDVSMALQRIEAARADVRLARGALLPVINGNATYAHRKFGLYTMDGAGNITTDIVPGQIVPIHLADYYLGLQTAWEADVWGKLRNRKKAALSRYLAGVEGRHLVVTNLVADLSSEYYELLALDNALEVIRESIVVQEKALELVILQKQANAVNELAVKQFRGQLLNFRALEYETLQQITESESRINFLLGRYPQAIARNKSDFNNPLPFKPGTGIPSALLKNRPDIRQAELQLMAAKADVKAARAAFYPSLSITGSLGFQAFRADLLLQSPESMAYSLLGGLVAPLVNRSAIKAAFYTATAAQQEAMANYQKSIINGYVEVYNEVARINNLEKITELKTEEVEVFSQSVETAGDLFRTSRASYLEVLMSQQRSLETRLQLIEIKKRQYKAAIDVYKALGGGWQ